MNRPVRRRILVIVGFIFFTFIMVIVKASAVITALPLCNDDANGNVPLGKSCNRYWQCQGGYPRLQRCPAMLVFDRRSLRCVVPPTEDCEVPTTPPPAPGELEEEGEQNIPQNLRPSGNQRGQLPRDDPLNLPPGAVPIPLRNNRPRN